MIPIQFRIREQFNSANRQFDRSNSIIGKENVSKLGWDKQAFSR